MKICITSRGPEFTSEVDPRFGRAAYFIIADTKTGEFEAKENGAVNAAGGAGVQAAQGVVEAGVKKVLTGNVGPNAFQVLNKAEISIIVDVQGTVEEAFNKFRSGDLEGSETSGPTVKGK
jgi:predicted Fe-Mo cluster-binding NifX family protein